MTSYRVCGFILESEMPLPEPEEAAGAAPDVAFRLEEARVPRLRAWFHEWRLPDGGLFLGFAREGLDYALSFPGLAEFRILSEGREIRCAPAPGAPEATLRHLLLDQVIPLVLSLRRELVLHASAVDVAGSAIAFMGESGRGKSTLAAFFCKEGARLVTDDCLLLRGEAAVASYPAVRIWRGAEKRSVKAAPCAGPVPLAAVYLLEEGEAIRFEPLAPRDACVELLRGAFILDVDSQRGWFDAAARAAARIRVSRLFYPRDFSRLREVREAILEDVGAPCTA